MAVSMHDAKYVTFELLLHVAFVADEFGVLCLNQLVQHKLYQYIPV